jgi:hypothetical protein
MAKEMHSSSPMSCVHAFSRYSRTALMVGVGVVVVGLDTGHSETVMDVETQ